MLLEPNIEEFDLPHAKLSYYPSFMRTKDADALFKTIHADTDWRQDQVKVFGKIYDQPRLTALYSETSHSYTYSGLTMFPEAFPEYLLFLKKAIESETKHKFNSLLINLYRDGSDSNGWHADNEKELGKNPVIASLSLGEVRPFHFKHRQLKDQRYKIELHHGSLLIMSGEMQHYWLHQIAKTKKNVGPRINLTFRSLIK